MSDYLVIHEISKALRHVLWEEFTEDPTIHAIVGSEDAIVFKNPTETARDSSNRLSLWLYQIAENEFVKNQPMLRARENGHSRSQFPPLALNFSYLVTPFTPSAEGDLQLLGKTMQVLYDNAVFVLRLQEGAQLSIAEEIRLLLGRLTLEELTRIWEALREPYRLSVCYHARVSRIDSQRMPEKARVVERTFGFGHQPPQPEA